MTALLLLPLLFSLVCAEQTQNNHVNSREDEDKRAVNRTARIWSDFGHPEDWKEVARCEGCSSGRHSRSDRTVKYFVFLPQQILGCVEEIHATLRMEGLSDMPFGISTEGFQATLFIQHRPRLEKDFSRRGLFSYEISPPSRTNVKLYSSPTSSGFSHTSNSSPTLMDTAFYEWSKSDDAVSRVKFLSCSSRDEKVAARLRSGELDSDNYLFGEPLSYPTTRPGEKTAEDHIEYWSQVEHRFGFRLEFTTLKKNPRDRCWHHFGSECFVELSRHFGLDISFRIPPRELPNSPRQAKKDGRPLGMATIQQFCVFIHGEGRYGPGFPWKKELRRLLKGSFLQRAYLSFAELFAITLNPNSSVPLRYFPNQTDLYAEMATVRDYWFGFLPELLDQCIWVSYADENTLENPWNDPVLQKSICSTLSCPESRAGPLSGMQCARDFSDVPENEIRYRTIFTHSTGGLTLASALIDGDCFLNRSSTNWAMLGSPLLGSSLARTLNRACPSSATDRKPRVVDALAYLVTGERVAETLVNMSYCTSDKGPYAAYSALKKSRFTSSKLVETPVRMCPVRENQYNFRHIEDDRRLCGTDAFGNIWLLTSWLSRYSDNLKLEFFAVTNRLGLEDSDGMVSVSSCGFGADPKNLTKLDSNHQDLTGGNNFFLDFLLMYYYVANRNDELNWLRQQFNSFSYPNGTGMLEGSRYEKVVALLRKQEETIVTLIRAIAWSRLLEGLYFIIAYVLVHIVADQPHASALFYCGVVGASQPFLSILGYALFGRELKGTVVVVYAAILLLKARDWARRRRSMRVSPRPSRIWRVFGVFLFILGLLWVFLKQEPWDVLRSSCSFLLYFGGVILLIGFGFLVLGAWFYKLRSPRGLQDASARFIAHQVFLVLLYAFCYFYLFEKWTPSVVVVLLLVLSVVFLVESVGLRQIESFFRYLGFPILTGALAAHYLLEDWWQVVVTFFIVVLATLYTLYRWLPWWLPVVAMRHRPPRTTTFEVFRLFDSFFCTVVIYRGSCMMGRNPLSRVLMFFGFFTFASSLSLVRLDAIPLFVALLNEVVRMMLHSATLWLMKSLPQVLFDMTFAVVLGIGWWRLRPNDPDFAVVDSTTPVYGWVSQLCFGLSLIITVALAALLPGDPLTAYFLIIAVLVSPSFLVSYWNINPNPSDASQQKKLTCASCSLYLFFFMFGGCFVLFPFMMLYFPALSDFAQLLSESVHVWYLRLGFICIFLPALWLFFWANPRRKCQHFAHIVCFVVIAFVSLAFCNVQLISSASLLWPALSTSREFLNFVRWSFGNVLIRTSPSVFALFQTGEMLRPQIESRDSLEWLGTLLAAATTCFCVVFRVIMKDMRKEPRRHIDSDPSCWNTVFSVFYPEHSRVTDNFGQAFFEPRQPNLRREDGREQWWVSNAFLTSLFVLISLRFHAWMALLAVTLYVTAFQPALSRSILETGLMRLLEAVGVCSTFVAELRKGLERRGRKNEHRISPTYHPRSQVEGHHHEKLQRYLGSRGS